jgi:hypothetical protein
MAKKLLPFRPRQKEPPKPRIVVAQPNGGHLSELLNQVFAAFGMTEEQVDIEIRIMQVEVYLNSLKGHVARENIVLRKQGLEGESLEELERRIRNATEADMKVHPSFYRAVIAQYRALKKTAP